MMSTLDILHRTKATLRRKHYSIRTEKSYLRWIRQFLNFHNQRHPREMGAMELEMFLNHLALDRRVAASTQPVLAGQARKPGPQCDSLPVSTGPQG
jgi:hypothetical protein